MSIERSDTNMNFAQRVADFDRIQGIEWVCRNSGEFRYERVADPQPIQKEPRIERGRNTDLRRTFLTGANRENRGECRISVISWRAKLKDGNDEFQRTLSA